MMVALVGTPSYAQTPSAQPALQADVASALATAKQTGKRTLIPGATTEKAEYFATPDGKVKGVIAAGNVRFRRNGSWVPVKLTLSQQPDGSVAPAGHPHNLWISGARDATSTGLASMGTAADQVSIGWQGVLPKPKLDDNKATYVDVRPGIDLVVQATATGFEQFTVVKSAAAAQHVTEISLPLTGAGVAAVNKDKNGRIRVHGPDGKQKAEIPTLMMWDASAKRAAPPKRQQVAVDVIQTPGAPTKLSLKPDQKWLTNPATVYPVTIDPYFDWSTTAVSTTVVQGYPTDWPDADSLFVGTYDATWSARSFVTWWANALQGMHIDHAKANFANPFSTSCASTPYEIWTTGPITDDTSWANQPAWQHKETTAAEANAEYDAEHNISYCNDSWVSADVTSFFQRAATNNVATPTMGLRAADETDYTQYKQFWSHNYSDPAKFPYVEVTYSQPVTHDPTAFNQLLQLNPDLTAAELDSSMQEAAAVTGLSYNQAVMKALGEAQLNAAPAGGTSLTSTQKSATINRTGASSPSNPTCNLVSLGVARYRGDIFWSAASSYGVPHGHMGIFSETGWVVEARGKGQNSGEFHYYGRKYCKNIEKMDVATTIATQGKAANYAMNYMTGKPYSSNFYWNKGGDISDLNCSELVYKAYKRSVNIDLDGNGGTGVYPNDIKNSTKTRTYQTITS